MTPERSEFIENLENAYSSFAKILFSWEKLSNGDSQLICDGYPFAGSFDEWLAEYREWMEKVQNLFEKRTMEFSPTISVGDLKKILESFDDDIQIVVYDEKKYWWNNITSVELPDGETMYTITFHTSGEFDTRQIGM